MKTNHVFGVLGAIAFSFAIFFSGCNPHDNENYIKASVMCAPAENVSYNSATLVAFVTPNEDNTRVSFEYSTDKVNWQSQALNQTFNGNISLRVTCDISGLQTTAQYSYRIKAENIAGSIYSSTQSFTTYGPPKAIVAARYAENVTITSAKLVAMIIPLQYSATVSFQYSSDNIHWQDQAVNGSFTGNDSISVSCELSNLQANTEYSFRLKATNVAGETTSDTGSFMTYALSDYDGNLYHTVTIGSQTWLKENLRTTHYANGDPIANVTDLSAWVSLTTGAYCWYNNDPKIGEVYGALYNWYIGADPRELIKGWHVPDFKEFYNLGMFLNKDIPYYSAPMLMEVGHAHWGETKKEATNSSGFTALPNGGIDPVSKIFTSLGEVAYFWTTEEIENAANGIYIDKDDCWLSYNYFFYKNTGFGLRLLKN